MPNPPTSLAHFQQMLVDAAETLYQMSDLLPQPLDMAAQAIVNSMTSGGKVICAGQGQSAWLSQLMAHKLVHGHSRQRPPLAGLDISLDVTPGAQVMAGSLSSRLAALGQAGDIWLGFAPMTNQVELLQTAQVARDLDMTLVVMGSETDGAWPGLLRDTDIWLALPGSDPAASFCSAWWALHGLCEAVDVHLLGESS